MPTKAELRAKADELRKALAKLDKLIGKSDARQRDADRMRALRESTRNVVIPPCQDRERRILLEEDDAEWLRWYFGGNCTNPFWYDFTFQQKEMIAAIRNAITYGGDQAIAASRGEGKTTLVERLLLKYTLQGVVSFSVLFSATGASAENSLESIKNDIAENDRLWADYPEVCEPVRALENTPNRAHYQTVSGMRHDTGEAYHQHPSKFSWCGNQIVLPNVPGSPSAGAIIATRGLDAAVRGLKKRGKRPQLAVIDDPDTEETARSEEQAKKLEDRIDKGIGGLGGQQRGIARVMLTTLQSRVSASYKFTDPKEKPTWKGRRFRYLIKPPDRLDLWQEYVAQRQADLQSGDDFARTAHRFYLDNRAAMDAGAVVANPHRFDASQLPDGSQLEVSSLQRYYNEVARIGPEAVATEYDNDPPEETGPVESGITPHRIQRQLSGYPRLVVPASCTVITQGIDVRKTALHWVIRAWMPDGTGFTIGYGVHEIHGTKYGSDEGVDAAIRRAILARMEEAHETPLVDTDGQSRRIDLTAIDARYRTAAVKAACLEAGQGVYPLMAFGKSAGCAGPIFTAKRRSRFVKPGDGWNLVKNEGDLVWLIESDADRWKAWEHDRWMTDPEKPGAMKLYGEGGEPGGRLSDDEKAHHAYARHICNEVEIEEPYKGTIRRRWKVKSENNHWLDASCYANVAAHIKGIRLQMAAVRRAGKVPEQKQPVSSADPRPTATRRPTAAELAARTRGR